MHDWKTDIRLQHWILDGFPRTLGQGKLLDEHLRCVCYAILGLGHTLIYSLSFRERGTLLSLVVNVDVADEIILSRISDRWVHLPSGRVYNLSYNPPKVPGYDDETGEPLTKRPDDNPVRTLSDLSRYSSSLNSHTRSRMLQEIFARRLQQFYAATSPLLAYYASQCSDTTQLVTLTGATSDEIWPKLEQVMKSSFPALKERLEHKRRHSLSDAVLGRSDQESRVGMAVH